MSERKRFIILLVVAVASLALLIYARRTIGSGFTDQF